MHYESESGFVSGHFGHCKYAIRIPVYQRLYSWQRKQCEDLWEDVARAGLEGKPHFVGSILYVPETDATLTSIKKMLLIDGQQRMATLSLALAAFIEYLEEDEARSAFLQDTKVSSLRRSYLFNNIDYTGEARYKLILSQDDKDTLFSIVGDAARSEGCSQLLVDNYNFFRGRMLGHGFDARRFWAGLRSIQVIDTQLDSATDNAQLVDPLGLALDKRSAGGFGPGMPTYVNLSNIGEIEHVMALVNQC